MTLFEKCISIILKNEGGFQNDPADIGNFTVNGVLRGTKYGISARIFPNLDIKNLTEDQAKNIYFKYYWQPMNLEGIKDELLTLHIFDHAINCGKGTAIRMIQRLVETKADGIIGPVTKLAINEYKPISRVVNGYGLLSTLAEHYIYARYCYYSELVIRRPMAKRYLKGWHNRIEKTHF
jgi:lysozyme family protein